MGYVFGNGKSMSEAWVTFEFDLFVSSWNADGLLWRPDLGEVNAYIHQQVIDWVDSFICCNCFGNYFGKVAPCALRARCA